MPATLGILRATTADETRVPCTPEIAGEWVEKGWTVHVEAGAGAEALAPDAAFEEAGATITDRAEVAQADVVWCVEPPDEETIGQMASGATLVGMLHPLDAPEIASTLAEAGVTAFAMELVPRISRAQRLDALSAMGAVSGYKAALLGANALPRFFPLLSTAAGSIRPAQVVVIGAGVAGLQAIATARRLGAKVKGYDIREAAQEEVESLGASFIELDVEIEESQDAEGYGRALAQEKARQQTELLVPHLAKADVVISTALIPGRPAPLVITEAAVEAMPDGSVIVDAAASRGGNCALTRPGETVTAHTTTILGPRNLPALLPGHASQLYARTLAAFLTLSIDDDGTFAPDLEDEIIQQMSLTREGTIVNDRVRSLLSSDAHPASTD